MIKNQKGFTMIELIVVIAIIGILAAALALNIRGFSERDKVESSIKTFYSDLTAMRVKAFSENRTHGIYWADKTKIGIDPDDPNAAADYYHLRMDTDGDGNIDILEGTTEEIKTVQLDINLELEATAGAVACTAPVIDSFCQNELSFNEKGLANIANAGIDEVIIFGRCRSCDNNTTRCSDDNTSGCCDPADATNNNCEAADTSADCDNPDYPKYSCVSVALSRIKMGKWCDTDDDNTFDIGECKKR
ncbi:Prepilin-type cleavage/methylation protein [Candidatus Magnetoovum chiemensis]|nr:Prepilin-type cleavage/methylation protein [Candidatus Magnetoovum chiemensis]